MLGCLPDDAGCWARAIEIGAADPKASARYDYNNSANNAYCPGDNTINGLSNVTTTTRIATVVLAIYLTWRFRRPRTTPSVPA